MVYDGRTVSFPDANGSLAPGDIVELGADGAIPYDGATATRAVGVVSDQVTPDDVDAGDDIDVHTTGVVVANVASGLARGDTVADDWTAFSAEGAQFKQHDSSSASLDAGTAAVELG